MKAAVVTSPGNPPIWDDFEAPVANEQEIIVDVVAAALSQLTRTRASGRHYSDTATSGFIAGVDGVGWSPDGKPVYFALPRTPYGAMGERVPVAHTQTIAIPAGLDPLQAAAMANPGMSSCAALRERARIQVGETVLINGATGASGSLAVRIARHLGAARVIATGRDKTLLGALGADEVIALDVTGEELETRFSRHFQEGVDIVLDYLWGPSARAALVSAARHSPKSKPVRFIQIGAIAATDIVLPAAVLRSSTIELMGSGIGSVGTDRLLASISEVFNAATARGWTVPLLPIPMTDVTRAWSTESRERIVLTL
ncbi:zinc-binding alcohol dehydrogenase family protein [Novosphingobium sp. 9]|uniref:quinone oxidoreductase family protein n=1 Tax=Novosphingobium sp. 9 TaxID=2025349 RepID=UPI0021B5302A|nr:zinc-binding alcohol dehydrogenase family protein [Novosphingobium sp. 9]